jgi:hypothetical protein
MVPFVTLPVFGVNFPGLNDSAVIVQYLLALPLTLALHQLVQARAPMLSMIAMLSGIVGILAFVVVQVFWLSEAFGVTTYYILLGVAFPLIGAWLVLTGHLLGRSFGTSGTVRHSRLMGILAATYVAYPIWALWLGRLLLSGKRTSSGPSTRGAAA